MILPSDVRTKLAGASDEEIKAFTAALEKSKKATSTDVSSFRFEVGVNQS